MTDVVIQVGAMYYNLSPDRRKAVEQLADAISERQLSVRIDVLHRVERRYGLPWAETIAIYLAGVATPKIIGNVVDDVYAAAKKWATRQFRGSEQKSVPGRARSQIVTIYDANKNLLIRWEINEQGEREERPATKTARSSDANTD